MEVRMALSKAVLVALAAAVTITAAAGAGPGATRQRVAIAGHGVAANPKAARWTLTLLGAGALEADTMTETSALGGSREALTGKLGTLVIRNHIEYAEAGHGYHVGFMTWKVVRGTGQYAHVTGGGRGGTVWLDSGPWTSNREGLLTSR
jgi:hypothetical protein